VGVLRVLCALGDTKVEWDIDVEQTIREAERIFSENAARGYASFRVDDGLDKAERIDRLDPKARQILQIPQIVGG
jgi:hypothetical protein